MSSQGMLKSNAIGLKDLVMIAIGGMVGSAIFTLSGVTYLTAGPAAILSWIIGAAILLVYALNLAELASCYNKAGGTFVFPARVLGRTVYQRTFFGWIAGWGRLWDVLFATSFTAIYVSQYLGAIFPGVESYQVLCAIIAIIIVWFLNCKGIRLMGKTNNVLTGFLIAACAVFIIFAFINIEPANFIPFFGQGTGGKYGFLEAIPVAMLGYGCIIAIACTAEEVKDPRRNIPRALFYGMGIVSAIYLLMLIATYGLFSFQSFIESGYATYAPQKFAVLNAMSHFPWLTKLISLAAIFALFTTMLILCMDAGRTIMAISRAGLLPRKLGDISLKTSTPIVALSVGSAISLFMALFPQYAIVIVKGGAMAEAITIMIIAMTMIAHRRTGYAPPGTFRCPGGIFIPILTIIIILILITQFDTTTYIVTGTAYAIGLAIYLLAFIFNRKNFTLANVESDNCQSTTDNIAAAK